jgi:hypothetical protein
MPHMKRIFAMGAFTGAFALLICAPGRAQQRQNCTGNQDEAVDCFVTNGVSTGLLAVPKGMSFSQYKSYGIAISKVLQTPSAAIFLLGMAGAVADAAPPVNFNGLANQAAQDAFVNAIVAAGLKDGIITLPAETTTTQIEMFARELTASMTVSSGVTISPGGFLRMLDGYIIAATQTNGTINWTQVTTNIATLVTALQTTGLIKLPAPITVANVEAFALDAANAIVAYKTATGKAHL